MFDRQALVWPQVRVRRNTKLDCFVGLGCDCWHWFALTKGELSDELHTPGVGRVREPATNRVPRKLSDAEVSIHAKHVKVPCGSQGILFFTAEAIACETDAQGEARTGRRAREVDILWPFDLHPVGAHVLRGRDCCLWYGDGCRFAVKRPFDADHDQRSRMKLYT